MWVVVAMSRRFRTRACECKEPRLVWVVWVASQTLQAPTWEAPRENMSLFLRRIVNACFVAMRHNPILLVGDAVNHRMPILPCLP